jgi:septal ring factor EnvC (AmiA/AmiB activator)
MASTVLQFRTAQSDEAATCCVCGVEFASPVLIKRRNDGQRFHCPNGHQQHFTETEVARLQKELEQERKRREGLENDLAWQRAQAKNARTQETKAKNELKRIKTRVQHGVCPHCHRCFENLQRHMESKHQEKIASV